MNIDEVLTDLVNRSGSDLHLKVGRPPLMRISSDLLPAEGDPLTEEDLRGVLQQLIGAGGLEKLDQDFEYDGAYSLPEVARFRINAFRQMGTIGLVMRAIPIVTPTIEGMGMPGVLKDICQAPQGMVLVTGPTGSGKSTTLAAMINYINQTKSKHIITIEDPVEFVYTDNRATINQRQLGTDVKTLTEALRRALRQDPDIILMGEMRDRETIEMAMHAAETGHLVFSTLHTNDAKQTLDRVVDVFPSDAHHQVRSMLALTLKAIVSQRLVKRADGGGRIGAYEIMINSPQIRDLVQQGKTREIDKAIASGGDYYRMQTFNQALANLVRNGAIEADVALASTSNPNDLGLLLKGISGGGFTETGESAVGEGSGTTVTPAPSASEGEEEGPFKKFKITKGF